MKISPTISCIPANLAKTYDLCVETVYPYCDCGYHGDSGVYSQYKTCVTPRVQGWVISLQVILGVIVLGLGALIFYLFKKLQKIDATLAPEVIVYEENWEEPPS